MGHFEPICSHKVCSYKRTQRRKIKKKEKKCNDDDNWEVFSLIKLVQGSFSHISIHFSARGSFFIFRGRSLLANFLLRFSLILRYVWWLSHHTPLSVTQKYFPCQIYKISFFTHREYSLIFPKPNLESSLFFFQCHIQKIPYFPHAKFRFNCLFFTMKNIQNSFKNQKLLISPLFIFLSMREAKMRKKLINR